MRFAPIAVALVVAASATHSNPPGLVMETSVGKRRMKNGFDRVRVVRVP
ncbi:MAG: hypothetical protein K8T20_05375 [Planctomycetes bacterium]|nr:hypothetical protein [Planctomycetota bacterium]